MYVINLFGGPSTGKSTLAAYLFSILKSKYDLNCEYVTEYAKDLVYEKRNNSLSKDQLYILAKQNHRLLMIKESNEVDFIINDSPILLSNIFGELNCSWKSETFKNLVRETFNNYLNLNFLIERDDSFFRKNGRLENSIDEAKNIDFYIENELKNNEFKYIKIKNDVHEILDSKQFCEALKDIRNEK